MPGDDAEQHERDHRHNPEDPRGHLLFQGELAGKYQARLSAGHLRFANQDLPEQPTATLTHQTTCGLNYAVGYDEGLPFRCNHC